MEEYRLEVIRQLEHHSDKPMLSTEGLSKTPNNAFEFTLPTPDETDEGSLWTGVYENGVSPSSLELPNWEQLGSLAFDVGGVFSHLDLYM